MPVAPAAPTKDQLAQQAQSRNMAARTLILRGGVVGGKYQPPAINMWQPQPVVLPANTGFGSQIVFQPRNVGMIKRLVFRIRATITAGANDLNLAPWGLANLVSNASFFDLGNNQRINTTGWHLTGLASAKRRRVFAAAYTSDNPLGYGNNNNRIMYAPTTIPATTSSEVDFELEIPFVRNDHDLRGIIYGDVTNANMQIQLTINPSMIVGSTADATLAVYKSAGAGLGTIVVNEVVCFQNYLDQLPKFPNNAPVVPDLDVGTAYLLNNTSSALPVPNQDNSAAFVNSRIYYSTMFAFDNNGTLNVNGTDLTYVQLQSANFTNIINVDGKMLGLMDRNVLMDDFPPAMYYLDFSDRPIDTNQWGNMQLVIKPNAVGGAAAVFLYGWEAFGIIGLVNQGGSLQMGGS